MVEGDQALCAAVDIHLRQQGYTVDYAHTGEDGLHFALQNAYDLILMDRMLPGVDGLDAGADDYPAKPFAAEELLARIRALSRRPRQWESTSRLSAGDLELDTELAALLRPAGACSLSRREKQLLELFLRNAGQTLTRELLLSRVWGPDAPVEDGNLDNYIHFLRRRLRAVGSAVRLATVRSVGYRLEVGPY